MARGINLDQFRETLDTDAQKRCIAQEKTIKELHAQLKEKDALIKRQKYLILTLENKCYVGTKGILCIFCGHKKTCKAHGKTLW